MNGLFFAIGHELATQFLDNRLRVDPDGYVLTKPWSTVTSVKGVFFLLVVFYIISIGKLLLLRVLVSKNYDYLLATKITKVYLIF